MKKEKKELPTDLKILVVDPNAFHRAMLIDVLRNLGLSKVMAATNGMEALDLMRSRKFDVIFTEWQMPELGGLEMARLVRREEDNLNRMSGFILVSAVSSKEEIIEIRNAGVDEVVAKPFSGTAIRSRIFEIVYNRRPFIDVKLYAGPCRRRMRGLDYRGARRRNADGAQGSVSMAAVSSALMGGLKRMGAMLADPHMDDAGFRAAQLAAQEIQAISMSLRNEAITAAAQSLMRYLNVAGRRQNLDRRLVEQHLNALTMMKPTTAANDIEKELALTLVQAVTRKAG